jgi:isochorismate synthase
MPGESGIKTWVQQTGKFNYVEKINDVVKQQGFVYAPFHRKTNFPVVFFEPELIVEGENPGPSILEKIAKHDSLYPEYDYEVPYEVSKMEYILQSSKYLQSFNVDFPKAVLSRVHLRSKPKQFNAGEFLIKLLKNYSNAFCHLINIPGAGIWTGASPETLLRIDAKYAITVSLAGTIAKAGTTNLWTEKEQDEQQIVTDYIEVVFEKFNIKNFKKEKVQNIPSGNMQHLSTKFKFDKAYIGNQLGEFISELHPTPAVCGEPKQKALELIQKTEKHNREYYAGYCGTVNMDNKTDLFVNLRCLKILKDQLALYVGGGLTAQSQPEDEWQETDLKAQTLLSIL